MAALAGSKALMLFQSNEALFEAHDSKRVGEAIKSVQAVSDVLTTGSVTGLSYELSEPNNAAVMVGVVRNPEKIAVIVTNTDAYGYSNLVCHVDLDRHWNFRPHTLESLTLQLASAVGVNTLTNWQEVVDGVVGPVRSGISISNDTEHREVILSNVELDSEFPLRIFTAEVGKD